MSRYAILVVWKDGEEEYLIEGIGPTGPVALFRTHAAAKAQADFMAMGMDVVQSINVVKAPRRGRPRGGAA